MKKIFGLLSLLVALSLHVSAFASNAEAYLVHNGDGKAGVGITLGPGWHTYGPEPGDAGLPPRLDWSNSVNIENIEVFYPETKTYDEGGFTTYGYEGITEFPVSFTIKEEGQPTHLDLKLDILICNEICIPKTFEMGVPVLDIQMP